MEEELKYMVCTRCMTYNHCAFIEDALNGFARQDTTFPVVFCVIDDASVDGEQDILRRWAESRLVFNKSDINFSQQLDYGERIVGKLKGKENLLFVILLLSDNHYKKKSKLPYITDWMNSSKYIAHCEGDDYWTHPRKLQMQVDFMENHPDYVFCHTDFELIGGGYRNHSSPQVENDYFFPYYILNGSSGIGSLTVLYRMETYRTIPKLWFDKGWPMGDLPFQIEMSKEGKFKYLTVATACYRTLHESASHGDINKELKFFDSARRICSFYAQYYGIECIDEGYTEGYFLSVMKIAFKHNDKQIAKYYKQIAKNKRKTSAKMWIFYFATTVNLIGCILRKLRKDW